MVARACPRGRQAIVTGVTAGGHHYKIMIVQSKLSPHQEQQITISHETAHTQRADTHYWK